jgi:hypothetical protein
MRYQGIGKKNAAQFHVGVSRPVPRSNEAKVCSSNDSTSEDSGNKAT